MMQNEKTRRVCKLASLDNWELEHKDQDLRGRTLVTPDGAAVGRVDDMLVNLDEERVAALRLDDDRLVDIDHVDILGGKPVLLVPRASLPPASKDFDRNNMTTEHIPIVEERLEIGKREVELGKVRIRKRVVENQVSEAIPLREEHVRVERRDLDREISATDADSLFKDRTIEATETAEQAVVAKKAFVTGEVTVDKDVDTRTERVDETVRRTEVEIDREPNRR
jgi:uncharacterized protein (TIGR02271 family)